MQSTEQSENWRCESNDIAPILNQKLADLRRQYPERFQTPVHVLATANETSQGDVKARLEEASTHFEGKRIVLIPYYLGTDHWTGIIIEWNSSGRIERADFIDAVRNSQYTPDELQEQFSRVFPGNTLRARILAQHEDKKKSAVFTVTNFLTIAQRNDTTGPQSSMNSNAYSGEELPSADPEYQSNFAATNDEGNQSQVQELETKLSSGLATLNISDEQMLLKRIGLIK